MIVEAIDVHKVYLLGKTEIYALRGVNLSIDRGDFVCIMGPSGAGKSTLLHILGALDTPTKGTVKFMNEILNNKNDKFLARLRREKIGFIFQFFYLIPTLTAKENVMLPLIPIKPRWLERRAEELLELVGLKKRMSHKPKELSAGEQQRVAIARALINNPEIIIADEPTGNLDSDNGRQIIDILSRIVRDENKAVIVATHNMDVAKRTDRIVYLKDGAIVKVDELK